jgi:hypothetical protein
MTRTDFSPSNRLRRRLCPGSLNMEASIKGERPDSEYSAEGTRLHKAMTYPMDLQDDLTREQCDVVDRASQLERELVETVKEKHGLGPPNATIREREYHMRMPNGDVVIGHPDVVFHWDELGGIILCLDYKFGHVEVDGPDANHQLQAYLAAVSEVLAASHYYAAIVQPRIGRPPALAHYSPEAMRTIRHNIENEYALCQMCDAELFPHPDACKYCEGLRTLACPAARFAPVVLAKVFNAPEGQLADMSPEDRAKLLDIASVSKTVQERLWDAARALLEQDPAAIAGWKLKPSGNIREIEDHLTAYGRMLNANIVDPPHFLKACKLQIGKLTDAVRDYTGWPKKQAEEEIKKAVGDLIAEKPKAASLKRE